MSGDDWVPWESDEPAEFEDWFLGDDLADPFPGSDFDQDDFEDWESLAQSEAEDWRGVPEADAGRRAGPKVLRRGEPQTSPPPRVPWVYHLTSIANLTQIIQDGELRCAKRFEELRTVGNPKLTEGRGNVRLPFGKERRLEEYVSFYFSPFTPMMVWASRPDRTGVDDLVVLGAPLKQLAKRPPIAFTNGHSMSERFAAETRAYDNLRDLGAVDLDYIKAGSWNDPDPEKKKRNSWRYQAEILALWRVPFETIRAVGCLSEAAVDRVKVLVGDSCQVEYLSAERKKLRW